MNAVGNGLPFATLHLLDLICRRQNVSLPLLAGPLRHTDTRQSLMFANHKVREWVAQA